MSEADYHAPWVERKCSARVTARPVMLLACGFAPFFPYPSECYNGAQEAPMNIQLPLGMDKVAFLDWVQGREERYELDRGRVIMMTGGSRAHWQITANLFKALDARIDPQRWAVLPEFGVELQSVSVRFPDIIVDRAGEAPKDLTATAPVLIAEVLSPSSEQVDLGDKSTEYLQLQALRSILYSLRTRSKRGSGHAGLRASLTSRTCWRARMRSSGSKR
jgi:Uma2 family endonuclease